MTIFRTLRRPHLIRKGCSESTESEEFINSRDSINAIDPVDSIDATESIDPLASIESIKSVESVESILVPHKRPPTFTPHAKARAPSVLLLARAKRAPPLCVVRRLAACVYAIRALTSTLYLNNMFVHCTFTHTHTHYI